MLIGSRFGYVSELTTRGNTVSDFSIFNCTAWVQESALERTCIQYVGRVTSDCSFQSVLSLERDGTSVAFTCSGDHDPSGQPKPLLQSSRV